MSNPTPPPGYRPVHPMPAASEPSMEHANGRDRNVERTATIPVRSPHNAPTHTQRPTANTPNSPARQPAASPRPTPPLRRDPEPIAYESTPHEPPPQTAPTAGNSLLEKGSSLAAKARRLRASTAEPAYDGRSNDDFDVPAIGGKPSHGKGRQLLVRLGIPLGVLALGTGIAFAVGVNQGSSRIPASGAISQDEALRFRLSAFPVEQAAAFGQRYLDICLTRPAGADVGAARIRTEALARMATSGTDSGCGYSGTATAEAAEPRNVMFTGEVKSVKGYNAGSAAYLTYSVVYDTETVVDAVVPVWVNDRADPTQMRVVGNVGFMPSNRLGAPPSYTETRTKDSALSGQLKDTVIAPFLLAWGSSDGQQLNLTLTEDATFTARAGLRGVLVSPSITGVTVYTGRSVTGGGIKYESGDEVIAETHVQWTNSLTNTKQSASYQIRVRQVQGKWAVVDVIGSALDPTGGAVPNTAGSSDKSESGSTTTSPSSATSSRPPAPSTPPSSRPGEFDPAGVPG